MRLKQRHDGAANIDLGIESDLGEMVTAEVKIIKYLSGELKFIR
jgi:hypothetical protein